jgi:penicillin-binding protein 1A
VQRKWKWFKHLSTKQKIVVIGGPILILLILIPILTYLWFAYDISNPDRLMNRNNTGIVLEDKNGNEFYSYGKNNEGERVPLDKISDSTKKALLASEDKNFYKHSGISFTSLLAAVYANFAAKDATAYGGSTLTQQLVKSTLLTNNKSFLRKYQEIFLAIAVDRSYSKDEILDMYLNSVHFGEGSFGIKDAAKVYFNTTPDKLTLAQSSMLIGVLPAPSAYSPISGNATYAKERQTTVLGRMVEQGYITEADKTAALNMQLTYASQPEVSSVAPHFAQMVIDELNAKYGAETVTRSGFRVKTTLDLEWQKSANQYVAAQTALNAPKGGRNAALVAEDPTTGEIRALVGSSDFSNKEFGQVNMAVTPRQPGSSFKPIYYTEALAQGLITPSTHVQDVATDFGGYTPNNFDFRFRGDITIRNALPQSLNIPAVKVMQKLGVDQALTTAKRMGITTLNRKASEYGLPLALGAGEVKLTEMVNAYSAFANSGSQYTSTSILSVADKFNKEIYTYKPRDKSVVDPGAAFLISNILSDNAARAPTFGSSLNLSRHTAVKTGSTDNNVDAWTIGFTPNIVVGVWVGNNEHQPMTTGGSAVAGPIWRKMMERTFQDLPAVDFQQPGQVKQIRVCSSNGARVTGDGTDGTYQEYFLTSHPPEGTCEKQKPKDADNDGVIDANDNCPNTPAGDRVDGNGCTVKVDSDNDGVTDDKDKCPNTPANTEVDSTGCPVVTTPPPTISTDTDHDGVTDDKDNCPNTPANTPVDIHGCPVVSTPPGGQQGFTPMTRLRNS